MHSKWFAWHFLPCRVLRNVGIFSINSSVGAEQCLAGQMVVQMATCFARDTLPKPWIVAVCCTKAEEAMGNTKGEKLKSNLSKSVDLGFHNRSAFVAMAWLRWTILSVAPGAPCWVWGGLEDCACRCSISNEGREACMVWKLSLTVESCSIWFWLKVQWEGPPKGWPCSHRTEEKPDGKM